MRIFLGILVLFFCLDSGLTQNASKSTDSRTGSSSNGSKAAASGSASPGGSDGCREGEYRPSPQIVTTNGIVSTITQNCVPNPSYSDAKNKCDTASKEYRDVVRDNPEKEATAAEREEERIQTAEEKAADIQQQIVDLKQEQKDAEDEYNQKILDLQNLMKEKKDEDDAELARLIKESQDLVNQYKSNLNEERERIYNNYQRELRQQYNQCQIDAQKLLAALAEQGEQIRQARNSGALQYQSSAAVLGRESNRNRITRKVQEFYLKCVGEAKTQNEIGLKEEIATQDTKANELRQDIESKKEEIQRIINSQSEDQKAKLQEANNARVGAENRIKTIGESIANKQRELQVLQYDGPLKRETTKSKSKLARDSALTVAKQEAWDACCEKVGTKNQPKPGVSASPLCNNRRPRDPRDSSTGRR